MGEPYSHNVASSVTTIEVNAPSRTVSIINLARVVSRVEFNKKNTEAHIVGKDTSVNTAVAIARAAKSNVTPSTAWLSDV